MQKRPPTGRTAKNFTQKTGPAKGYGRPQTDKPYGKPAGNKPYGKPAGAGNADRPYGKPAAPAGDKSQWPYGKPAGANGDRPSAKPVHSNGDKPYGKPAGVGGDRPYAKPAAPAGDRPYGKPAGASGGRPYAKPVNSGDKPYGKPAGASGDKPYGKPVAPAGDKPYGKPAVASGGRPYAKPKHNNGDKPYGKPVGASGDRPYAKPVAPTGDKPYGKPVGSSGDKPYAKPVGANSDTPRLRPSSGNGRYAGLLRSGDKPYVKRAAPTGDKPYVKRSAPTDDKPYGKPAAPTGDKPYAKPAAPTGDRPYAKPTAPTGDKLYGKPAAPTGDKPFAKPFARPMGAPRPRPAFTKTAVIRPMPAKPAFIKRIPAKPALDNPRLVALNTLQDITQQDAYASLALDERLTAARLDPRDRDLTTELVYGTLERRLTIDHILNSLLDRPDTDPVARDILRLGAYQILYLDRVPDSAAVDESVKLARVLNREQVTGLINGTLRNLVRQKDALPLPVREDGLARYISVTHSLPEWIVERLIESFGAETAEEIASYRPREHPITVRRIAARHTKEQFEAMMTEKEWEWTPAKVENAYYVKHAKQIGLDKEFQQGFYAVQGEGSMLAAKAVAPRRGDAVLDACAAPGGKTACLSEAMQGTGRVHAWDVHEHRVELIRGMMNRLRLDNVRPAVRDATVFREDLEATMDAVLIDAPCSGLGVLLEKPDVRYRRKPEDIAALCETQAKLLDACSRYVKVGGTLVYATCTILPEENGKQIDAFLAKHRDFAPDAEGLAAALSAYTRPAEGGSDETPSSPGIASSMENGRIQFLPHRDGIEGFFIARLRRLPRA